MRRALTFLVAVAVACAALAVTLIYVNDQDRSADARDERCQTIWECPEG